MNGAHTRKSALPSGGHWTIKTQLTRTAHQSRTAIVLRFDAMHTRSAKAASNSSTASFASDTKKREATWRKQFRQRVIEAQGKRSNPDMADLLCMEGPNAVNTYSKYRSGDLPLRLVPRFARSAM
jgi:hypothetical protein